MNSIGELIVTGYRGDVVKFGKDGKKMVTVVHSKITRGQAGKGSRTLGSGRVRR